MYHQRSATAPNRQKPVDLCRDHCVVPNEIPSFDQVVCGDPYLFEMNAVPENHSSVESQSWFRWRGGRYAWADRTVLSKLRVRICLAVASAFVIGPMYLWC